MSEQQSTPKRVLFVCIGNSCRSPMAVGFAKQHGAGAIEVESAGTAAAHYVAPMAIHVMREKGIDIRDITPTQLTKEMFDRADVVVAVGCCPVDRLVPRLFQGQKYDWDIRDPIGGTIDDFRKARDEIEERVKELIEGLKESKVNELLVP